MARISIIGFGKIGQGFAAHILSKGVEVTAIDTNPFLIESFANESFRTNEPGVADILSASYKKQQLIVTGDFTAIADSTAVIIAIPLLVDQNKKILSQPFVSCVVNVSQHCASGTVIVVETSVPVGFARDTLLPALSSAGKQHGRDFFLAHSPERIKSGTMLAQLQLIPKVVGGLTQEATDAAYAIYKNFFPEDLLHRVESIEAAEMVKLAGMIYRDINIALSNQLAQFSQYKGINFTDLIPLINTDREANLLQPGIGVGGHCTPVYPYFMIENFAKEGLDFSIAKEGRKINDGMAAFAVSLVSDRVKNKTALILGLGFRPNVKEDSLSTTYLLRDALLAAGFSVSVHDTEYTKGEIKDKGLEPADLIYSTNAEVVFLVTLHQQYEQLDFDHLATSGVKFFVDGRNSFKGERVRKAGIEYFGIGKV